MEGKTLIVSMLKKSLLLIFAICCIMCLSGCKLELYDSKSIESIDLEQPLEELKEELKSKGFVIESEDGSVSGLDIIEQFYANAQNKKTDTLRVAKFNLVHSQTEYIQLSLCEIVYDGKSFNCKTISKYDTKTVKYESIHKYINCDRDPFSKKVTYYLTDTFEYSLDEINRLTAYSGDRNYIDEILEKANCKTILFVKGE